MDYVYNDGGRQEAGFKGNTGDCVARAIAIAADIPYKDVYNRLAEGNASQRATKHTGKRKRTAREGIYTKRKWFKDYMQELGFTWVPTMQIGSGCKVHLRKEDLPSGRIIARVTRHYCAIIDGVINDTYNPARGGARCVYGYWVYNDQAIYK